MNRKVPEDLQSICKQMGYKILKQLGEGSFGIVYLAQNEQKEKRALKCINKNILINFQKNDDLKKTKFQILNNQTSIMQKIRNNENILMCYGKQQNQKWKVIVLEYCEGGNLFDLIQKQTKLSEEKAVDILAQLIHGFAALHQNKIIHRDLKAENILINQGIFKIANFGSAIQTKQILTAARNTIIGSRLTMAPEVMKEQKYGIQADMWSLGVIFYQMISGFLPFDKVSIDQKDIYKVRARISSFKISEAAKKFIKAVLVIDSDKRLKWIDLYKMMNQKKQIFEQKLSSNDDIIIELKSQVRKLQSPVASTNISIQSEKSNDTAVKQEQTKKIPNQKHSFFDQKFQRDVEIIQNIFTRMKLFLSRQMLSKQNRQFILRLYHLTYLINSQLMKIIQQNKDYSSQQYLKQGKQMSNQFKIISKFNFLSQQIAQQNKSLSAAFQIYHQKERKSGFFRNFINKSSAKMTSNEIQEMNSKFICYRCTPKQHFNSVAKAISNLYAIAFQQKYQKTLQDIIQFQRFIHQKYSDMILKRR